MPDQENISARSGVHYWEGAVMAHPAGPAGQNRRAAASWN